eukprot:gb/GECG01009005.1/.p1 GENE.gb/GECG01009005.1/~~gb/GECG01009005.1/.p1  ORF type:complete len:100 (+),score=0.79 gb/GECG01009005.1/:1-300(+)
MPFRTTEPNCRTLDLPLMVCNDLAPNVDNNLLHVSATAWGTTTAIGPACFQVHGGRLQHCVNNVRSTALEKRNDEILAPNRMSRLVVASLCLLGLAALE